MFTEVRTLDAAAAMETASLNSFRGQSSFIVLILVRQTVGRSKVYCQPLSAGLTLQGQVVLKMRRNWHLGLDISPSSVQFHENSVIGLFGELRVIEVVKGIDDPPQRGHVVVESIIARCG